MNINTVKTRAVALAGFGIAVLVGAGGLAAAGAAAATPPSSVTVQDQGGASGAAVDTDGIEGIVDTDGTVGAYKRATDGNAAGPIEIAAPQVHAKN